MRNRRLLAVIGAMSLLGAGCAAGSGDKYLKTDKIEVKETQTKEGAKIVIEKQETIAEANVIEKSTNVKTVSKITSFEPKDNDTRSVGTFDISPDGQRVVMVVFEQKGTTFSSQLWSTTRTGGAMTKVTSGNYKDLDPSFSPDGSYIYFASNRGDERPKVWRIKSDGLGGLTKVTTGSTLDRTPRASSDNEHVHFASQMGSGGEWQLWSCTTSGALPTQMTLGAGPVASPNGKKVLFVRQNETSKKFDIWMMDSDGSNQTQLTQGDANYQDPKWDPTGKFIVFSSDAGRDEQEKNNFDVYFMGVDGTNRTQLTTNGSWDGYPAFDPLGQHIYFLSNRGGAWNIWRMELSFKIN